VAARRQLAWRCVGGKALRRLGHTEQPAIASSPRIVGEDRDRDLVTARAVTMPVAAHQVCLFVWRVVCKKTRAFWNAVWRTYRYRSESWSVLLGTSPTRGWVRAIRRSRGGR
jgi:hypothetical protein